MFNDLKLAFQSFRKNWADYLALSFAFSMIVFIGILLGQAVIGLLLGFICVIIPAIISLKFCAFQAYDKPQVEYRSLKIGFLTFFKSIRVYGIVILKPLILGFLAGCLIYSFFLDAAVMVASETMPNLLESMTNYETFAYTYEEMRQIERVAHIMDWGAVISVILGYLVFFVLKLKRDFIPFVAFEMPINSKRAIAMNNKILNKKRYFSFLLINVIFLLMMAIPAGLAFLTKLGLETNATFSPSTVMLLMILTFCVFASPIVMMNQLYYVQAYKAYSKPFKEDFNNELKNVIKEMEELAKKINENDKK